MKIIFCDFDGVLNSVASNAYHQKQIMLGNNITIDTFDPIACSNLQTLLEQDSNLKLVISSSWRDGRTIQELSEILNKNSIDGSRIIDKTPSLNKTKKRGKEIQTWLELHSNIKQYVILDDVDDMLKSQKNNFVKINPKIGLTLVDIAKTAKILGINFK